ncbi:hypothetical protein J7I93_03350 [Bacillus sp. ISL-47]|uniref:hypothetical protein n=1 Tax=Bacillus sp. ISL-47 TaxID=2819130 RepID=UPI001BE51DA0|nr:hypothetical protein [Bacillus sp. ISL-47]MBT2687215.1 hypothetical protein [Bacillus sp. ISL-47]
MNIWKAIREAAVRDARKLFKNRSARHETYEKGTKEIYSLPPDNEKNIVKMPAQE